MQAKAGLLRRLEYLRSVSNEIRHEQNTVVDRRFHT